MSAPVRDHHLPAAPSAEQIDHALEQLSSGEIALWVTDSLRLCMSVHGLRCDVIDDAPSAHRCAFEYEVMVENARHALDASPFSAWLSALHRTWRVVVLQDDGYVSVWAPDP